MRLEARWELPPTCLVPLALRSHEKVAQGGRFDEESGPMEWMHRAPCPRVTRQKRHLQEAQIPARRRLQAAPPAQLWSNYQRAHDSAVQLCTAFSS